MANTRDYMDYLDSEIGIAPAYSQEEYQASQVIEQVMSDHGLETAIEEFDGAGSATLARDLLSIAMFVSLLVGGLVPDALHVIFLLIALVAAGLLAFMRFGRNIFDGLGPTQRSQNVVAVRRANSTTAARGSRPIVIVAHYDTPRESPLRTSVLASYQSMLIRVGVFCPAVVAGTIVFQIMLFLPEPFRMFMWVVGLIASLPAVALAILTMMSRRGQCTVGANDNKSSVAALLSIVNRVSPADDRVAEALQDQPRRMVRRDDPKPKPVVRRVEVVEEVAGARHGEETLRALGLLPTTCEIVYEEPRVSYVDEIEGEPQDEYAEEPRDVSEGYDFDRDDAGLLEVPSVEDERPDEEDYRDEEDLVDEDVPEPVAEADASASDDESSEDETAEEENTDDKFDDSADDNEEEQDGEFDDYDEYDDFDDYDDYEEDDFEDEDVAPIGSSIGKWFSTRMQAIKEHFASRNVDKDEDEESDDWISEEEAEAYEATLDDESEEYEELDEELEDDYEDDYEDEDYDEIEDEFEDDYEDYEEFDDEEYDELEDDESYVEDDDELEDDESYVEDDDELEDDYYDELEDDYYDELEDAYAEEYEVDQELEQEEEPYVQQPKRRARTAGTYGVEYFDEYMQQDEVPAEMLVPASDERDYDAEADLAYEAELDEEYASDFEYDDDEYEEEPEREPIAVEFVTAPEPVEFKYDDDFEDEVTEGDAESTDEVQEQTEDALDDEYLEDEEYYDYEEDYEDEPEEQAAQPKEKGPSLGQRILGLFRGGKKDKATKDKPAEDEYEEEDDYLEGDEEYYDEYEEWEDEDWETLEEEDTTSSVDDGPQDEVVPEPPVAQEEVPEPAYDVYEDEYLEDEEYLDDEADYFEEEDYYEDEEADFEVEQPYQAPVATRPPDPNELHFDREEDDDILERDDSGLNTFTESEDLYEGEITRESRRERPAAIDDPTWGTSNYQPTRPAINIARRAALFDLPDPAGATIDPLADDYDYEEDVAATQEEANRSSERASFWDDDERSGGWKGGATWRDDLRDDEGDYEEGELQDAVLEMGDEFFDEHDVWFVATGASDDSHSGIKAFLDAHRRDIRGAFLVNLECVGSGVLATYVREGLTNRRRADRRLVRMIGEIARDLHINMDTAMCDWGETDAAIAMGARVRSVTIVGLDENDLPCLSHTPDDVPENVNPTQVDDVVRIVTEVIRRA